MNSKSIFLRPPFGSTEKKRNITHDNNSKVTSIGDDIDKLYESNLVNRIANSSVDKIVNNVIDTISDNSEAYEETVNQVTGEVILSMKDILASIPQTATKDRDLLKENTHVEWRWRFFDLKGRKLIEISRKEPDKDRIYVDNKGNWINFILKGNWEQFMTDSRYYYA